MCAAYALHTPNPERAMIDVLMVLLILLMVAVPMSRRAVDVQLSASAPGDPRGAAIVLEVRLGGRLALDR